MRTFFILLILISIATSCTEDPITDTFEGEQRTYLSGFFITNEGPFQNGTGTISFFDRFEDAVENKIFQNANDGSQLGNIVQSMAIEDTLVWIIVNNANRIVVANPDFMTEIKSYQAGDGSGIPIAQPRYIVSAGNEKAYITQHGSTIVGEEVPPSVLALNIKENTYSLIETGNKPEKLVLAGNLLYVPNWGGIERDSTVTIIRTSSDTIVTNLVVPDNPVHAVKDKNNGVWVLCQGYNDFAGTTTPGALIRIVGDTTAVNIPMPQGADNLVIDADGENLFYTREGKTYKQSIEETVLNMTPFLERSFYSLGIDIANGNLLGADAGDFTSNGVIYFYDSETAAELASYEVGIIPNEFIVKD